MNKRFTTEVTAVIEKLSHDGRGIARIDGKTTFIQGALPDETVVFTYLRRKKDFDEGAVVSVTTPSPHRVEPNCPHYALCGGCSLQHLEPQRQIHEKQALFLDILARIGHCQPENILPPLAANYWHYRNKARLSVRYVEKLQSALVGFRERNSPRYITKMEQCPVLNRRVDEQLMNLRALIASFDSPKDIAQIEVAAGDDDVALIFRNLSDLTLNDEERLKAFARNANFRIYLQPKGPDSVYLFYPTDASDYLTYSLPDQGISFLFHPTDFTQINGALNRQMVPLALKLLDLNEDDVVLDLFCGLGNFSLPLAKKVSRVIGIEGSEKMVLRAGMNAAHNGINNAEFLSANLDDPDSFQSLELPTFTKLLIDPPRSGALEIVNAIERFNPIRIVYVSCNPATLARDADILVNQKGYRMTHAGVMDMFPQSAHVESIALFERVSHG
jgi:23S rRNA (uracil1939-C5)-methyltransferase